MTSEHLDYLIMRVKGKALHCPNNTMLCVSTLKAQFRRSCVDVPALFVKHRSARVLAGGIRASEAYACDDLRLVGEFRRVSRGGSGDHRRTQN